MSLEQQPLFQDAEEVPFEIEKHGSRLKIQATILLQLEKEIGSISMHVMKAFTTEYRNLIHTDIKNHIKSGDEQNYLTRYEAAVAQKNTQEQEAIINEIKGRVLQAIGILN